MRLKGELADEGINLLVQSCLPPLEKVEREIILMFSKENVFLFAVSIIRCRTDAGRSGLIALCVVRIGNLYRKFSTQARCKQLLPFLYPGCS